MWQVYAWITLISLGIKKCPLTRKLNLPWFRFTFNKMWMRKRNEQIPQDNHTRTTFISWVFPDHQVICSPTPALANRGRSGMAKTQNNQSKVRNGTCFQPPASLLLTVNSSQEPSPKNAAFYLLAHQWCKYVGFCIQTGWMCSEKNTKSWRAAAGNSSWKATRF